MTQRIFHILPWALCLALAFQLWNKHHINQLQQNRLKEFEAQAQIWIKQADTLHRKLQWQDQQLEQEISKSRLHLQSIVYKKQQVDAELSELMVQVHQRDSVRQQILESYRASLRKEGGDS